MRPLNVRDRIKSLVELVTGNHSYIIEVFTFYTGRNNYYSIILVILNRFIYIILYKKVNLNINR